MHARLLWRRAFGWGCVAAAAAAGDMLRMPAIFSDGMVLQRGRPIAVWGWASPGATVTVRLANAVTQVVAAADGAWRAVLPAMPSGGPHELSVTSGGGARTVRDVVVGEVWVCSGQSNMAMPVRDSTDAEEAARAAFPLLRAFRSDAVPLPQPTNDMPGVWLRADSPAVTNWYATAFYFGRRLHRELGVPVGLLMVAWGGTPVEAWMPRPLLQQLPAAAEFLTNSDAYPARYPDLLREWEERRTKLLAAGRSNELRQLRKPVPPDRNPSLAAVQYNSRIAPITQYPIRGAIWYQGEANSHGTRALSYAELLSALIAQWRRDWDDEFPFGIVQLPGFRAPSPAPVESNSTWAVMREQQLRVVRSVPRTGLAVTVDLGEADNVHPKRKTEVGERLAAWALREVYGRREVMPCGPLYREMRTESGAIRVRFDYARGLHARGGEPAALAIAGTDRVWRAAMGRIEDEELVVSSPEVPRPVAVRYGWADNPPCNLYNDAGLPASPFRTDDWPLDLRSAPVRAAPTNSPSRRSPAGAPAAAAAQR
ncbi:MAG: sialate O-acetylesterase [Kiritimatiellae bacterium]|nr:sialate O-acetylesterase [Kiritimatiellia bacterium]